MGNDCSVISTKNKIKQEFYLQKCSESNECMMSSDGGGGKQQTIGKDYYCFPLSEAVLPSVNGD